MGQIKTLNLLKSEEDLSAFESNFRPQNANNLLFQTLEDYSRNKILIVAEHAQTTRIKSPKHGKKAYIGIGDANTATLAKLGAWHSQSAYIIPTILRTELDLARPSDAEGMRLRVLPFMADEGHEETESHIPISTNKNLMHIFEFYHKTIESLNPKLILSYHGMHSHRQADVLLGFGPDRSYIGGSKNAFSFRRFFVKRLKERLKERNVRIDITVKVSKSLFTGSKNYTLYRHVKEYNEKNSDIRFGIHVEFNRHGRVMKEHPSLPKLRYQIAAQVLAECAEEWVEKQTAEKA
ncbi:MAG: hypothetical protein HY364_01355 [Candidatus Aenigmarchaeota archaeon]|nr:hypothetical protein [Candidatus Aenigmarchaeota archaeon]